MSQPTRFRIPNEVVYDGDIVCNSESIKPEYFDRVREMPMEEDDVIIATYPKAGTTWMQELVSLVINDADIDKVKQTPLFLRCRYLEVLIPDMGVGVDLANNDPHPRSMKSHLPARYYSKQLAAKKGKFIIVMRNPKDNLVSYYHFYKNVEMFGPFTGTWDEFFELFRARHMMYGDMFDWVLGWWAQRDNKNILLVKYEDMKKDIHGVIRQVALHCGKDLNEEGVEKIAEHISFSSLKKNPMVNYSLMPELQGKVKSFLRKGEIGDWKNYFSEEQSAFVDELYETRYVKEGLKFDFE